MYELFRYLLGEYSKLGGTNENDSSLADLNQLYSYNIQVGNDYTIEQPAIVLEFYISPLVYFIGVILYLQSYASGTVGQSASPNLDNSNGNSNNDENNSDNSDDITNIKEDKNSIKSSESYKDSETVQNNNNNNDGNNARSRKRTISEEDEIGYILEAIYIPSDIYPNFLIDINLDEKQFIFLLALSLYENSKNI